MIFRDARRAECRGRVHQEEIRRYKGGQLEVLANGKACFAMSIASSHAGASRLTTRRLVVTLGPSLTLANHPSFSHPLRPTMQDKWLEPLLIRFDEVLHQHDICREVLRII